MLALAPEFHPALPDTLPEGFDHAMTLCGVSQAGVWETFGLPAMPIAIQKGWTSIYPPSAQAAHAQWIKSESEKRVMSLPHARLCLVAGASRFSQAVLDAVMNDRESILWPESVVLIAEPFGRAEQERMVRMRQSLEGVGCLYTVVEPPTGFPGIGHRDYCASWQQRVKQALFFVAVGLPGG